MKFILGTLTILVFSFNAKADLSILNEQLIDGVSEAYGMVCVELSENKMRCSRANNPKHGFELESQHDEKAYSVKIKVLGDFRVAFGDICTIGTYCGSPILKSVTRFVASQLLQEGVCEIKEGNWQVFDKVSLVGDCTDIYGKQIRIKALAKVKKEVFIIKKIRAIL